MARPKPQPSLPKAPTKEHPLAPSQSNQQSAKQVVPASPVATEVAMFSTRLDADLRRRLKVHAAERGQTIQEVTEAALRAYLQGAVDL